ncbi:MAG: hypothetical protein ACR2M4_03160 [Actinomycetota bacterium]
MCYDAYVNLKPDKVLVLDATERGSTGQLPERYGEDATQCRIRDLDLIAGKWMQGLDTIVTFETPYWHGLFPLAKSLGVRTVMVVMPEYHPPGRADRTPDVLLNPSSWWPHAAPAPQVCWWPTPKVKGRLRTQAKTFLHPAGAAAKGDRAGTEILLGALPHITEPVKIIIRAQNGADPTVSFSGAPKPSCVELDVRTENRANHLSIYDEADVAILPRRYAGLSLPLWESLAHGLPAITLDREPERDIVPDNLRLASRIKSGMNHLGGPIPTYDAEPLYLATKINQLSSSPHLVKNASLAALTWADEHSWERLGPIWRQIEER